MEQDKTYSVRCKIEDLEDRQAVFERAYRESEETVSECGRMSGQREELYGGLRNLFPEDLRFQGMLLNLEETGEERRREEKKFLQKIPELRQEERDKTEEEIRRQQKILADLYTEEGERE